MLTRKDVAEMLGISVRTLDRLVKGGKMVSYKYNGAVRIKRSDVQKYLENTQQQSK